MEISDDITKSLNGGFNGLYGEVCISDVYRLKQLPFIPDVIFDFGANIGTFSRYARTLFPDALIIAVEPDENNYETFKKFTNDDKLILLNKAIGNGSVYKVSGAVNGAHECYVSNSVGLPEGLLVKDDRMTKTEIESVTIYKIFEEYQDRYAADKVLVKIDIEGNENSVFEHELSMEMLRQMDYIAMEIHRIALTGKEQEAVNELTDKALKSFNETHNCLYIHPMFYAIKKPLKLKYDMEIYHRIQLIDLLKHLNLPLIAAEIGIAEGYSSADFLSAGLDRLFMVDAWATLNQTGDGGSPQSWHDANYNATLERVKPFGEKAVILRGLSTDMAKNISDKSLGLVYVDGDHSYSGCLADLNSYYPKLVEHGILAGHDICNEAYGVKQAVEEFCKEKGLTYTIIPENAEHPEYASFFIIV